MTVYSIVDATGSIINNIILEDIEQWRAPEGCSAVVNAEQAFEIGGTLIGGNYAPPVEPPAPPPSIPQTISDRQFFQQLAILGIITEADALASNAAVIPPPLLQIINAMPADQQFNAKMIVSGATVFERTNPLTIVVGTAYGWTADQIDAFFVAAAAL